MATKVSMISVGDAVTTAMVKVMRIEMMGSAIVTPTRNPISANSNIVINMISSRTTDRIRDKRRPTKMSRVVSMTFGAMKT